MTALESVAVYLPATRVPVADLAAPLGMSAMQVKLFHRFHNLREVALAPDDTLGDLLLKAARALPELAAVRHRIRYVLYARAFPVVAPYPVNPLRAVCGELGLEHALTFTVTQQSCATGLLALDMAGRLLAEDVAAQGSDPAAGGPLALVLAGEKAFTQDARLLPETAVFAEGAAACLVSPSGPRDRLLAYAATQRGDLDSADAATVMLFQQEYRPGLAAVIRRALADSGTALADVRLILPHNVNIVTWQRLCRLIGYPVERVVTANIPTTGHVFCADAFINYRSARDANLLAPGDRYVVAAVGAGHGATFAAMVFEH